MCGIAGIISSHPESRQQLMHAVDSLNHRGPDQLTHWTDEAANIAFAHTRLCIIDLSGQAAQPFIYAGRYVMVYNGELYNYLELRQKLQQKGYSFSSASDTEVTVAAYAAYGKDCLQHFEGMFAFAIWDCEEQVLFAARDRFGEKPFYFFQDGQRFVFASEMKALWKAGVPKQVNHAMLYNFISIGYTANPADPQETFYAGIHKLPAANFLEYRQGVISLERYWNLEVDGKTSLTEEQARQELQQLLFDSVAKRMRSDVPVGTSLSGGLDSASIVALCAQTASEKYTHKCFTARFAGFEKDETQMAAQVAEQFRLQHFIVDVDATDLQKEMDLLMYHQEEPIGSASALAQLKVFQAAKEQGIRVLLDGQGADEIFAGYHKYYRWLWQQLYRQRALKRSGELSSARARGVREPFGWAHKTAALLPDFTSALWQSRRSRKAFQNPMLNRDFAAAQKTSFYYTLPATPDLNGALYFNTVVYGLEELLRYADRNSMAHSVELRLPFLAHPVVEFLFQLPPHFKIQEGWTKWLLRKTMESSLPENIVWRTDKVGFEPPQKKWMQHPAVREQIIDAKKMLVQEGILSDASLRSYTPEDAYAPGNFDWRAWSASYLFR